MRVIAAPDSFKGSLSAGALCSAIDKGVRKVFPQADILQLPMADGGEGTIDSMVHALNGEVRTVSVTDPLGRDVIAKYGVLRNGLTAVIEMAQASGLPLLKPQEYNPKVTSTYGTGMLIKHCLDEGFREILIGLGGSATNDAGAGMMKALGMEFLDSAGCRLPEGGIHLKSLHHIDDSALDERIQKTTFILASDVTNPLCGDQGASAVFGPQKGANPADVVALDSALRRYAEVLEQQLGFETGTPGSGAAGGTGASAIAFLEADMRSGIELVMDYYRFDSELCESDLVITGEGRIDHQTSAGKVISGICKRANRQRVPVIALCGSVQLNGEEMTQLGLTACFPIANGPCSLKMALRHTAIWTEERTEQIFRLLDSSKLHHRLLRSHQ